MLRNREQ